MKYKPNGYQALKIDHSYCIRMCRIRRNAVFALRKNMTRHVYLLTYLLTENTPKILNIIDTKLINVKEAE